MSTSNKSSKKEENRIIIFDSDKKAHHVKKILMPFAQAKDVSRCEAEYPLKNHNKSEMNNLPMNQK
jgi:hypothetical protein